jgi:hypothetical protein
MRPPRHDSFMRWLGGGLITGLKDKCDEQDPRNQKNHDEPELAQKVLTSVRITIGAKSAITGH